jgi:CHAT domain-containing protein
VNARRGVRGWRPAHNAKGMWTRFRHTLFFVLFFVSCTSEAGADGSCPCLVVDEVAKASAAERAGLQVGDRLTGWVRSEAGRGESLEPLCSPFRLFQLQIDLGAQASLVLLGERGDEPGRWPLLATGEGLRVRACPDAPPTGDAAAWDHLRSAQAQSAAKAWTEADRAFEEARDGLTDPSFRAQVLRAWGDSLAARGERPAADQRLEQALEEDQRGGSDRAAALDHYRLARSALRRDYDVAEKHLRAALEIRQRVAPGSIEESVTWSEIGALDYNRGRRDRAESALDRALAIQTALAPDSLEIARTIYLLGHVFVERDLAKAEAYQRRALAIRERLAPRSVVITESLNGLGILSGMKGDVRGAAEHFRRALALIQELSPDDWAIPNYLSNLGKCAELEGDLVLAEDYYRRALDGIERVDPHSGRAAIARQTVGLLARLRGDYDAADAELRRALAIGEKLDPRGNRTRDALSLLADVALARGDAGAARDLLVRALEIDKEQSADGVALAYDLALMAKARCRLGDLDGAEADAQRALGIREAQAKDSGSAADLQLVLGEIAMARGEPARAAEFYGRALAIQTRSAPGSVYEAEGHHELGRAWAKMEEEPRALDSYCAAINALESQGARLGGTESSHVAFRAKYYGYYHDCLAALTRAGREPEAIQVLERSRARSLLTLLAERDLAFAADLPSELAAKRREADREYDGVQSALASLDPKKDEAEIARLHDKQREARVKQEEVATRIRKASPRFASLQYPEPLDLAAVRGALDPGTLLLAYSVGRDETVILAVAPAGDPGAGLWVERVPIGERALRGKIEAFRELIRRPAAAPKAALIPPAVELYHLLIEPVEAQLAARDRLLLMPDGPLHALPFAALVRPPVEDRVPGSFLVEWKPLHIVPSATVYAELRKSRRGTADDARLVAFGDPLYPAAPSGGIALVAHPAVREITSRFALTPLPFTRQEVDGVARLFRARAQTYFGPDATEERAKSIDRGVRYVHFACHGYLDSRFPLNSALALTIPPSPAAGEDNGLLQAWEIFDQVRLDADLVVLSACDTALGKETGGEGLLGLTRAFFYSGARSVLGTLWGISDTASPLLMERFYRHLRGGKSRDAALQAAQIDFIRGHASVRGRTRTDLSHPFRWAAYQLSGDYR